MNLNHGDKVLFGKNLFVVIFPGENVQEDELNYEECMKSMFKDQLSVITNPATQALLDQQLEEMRKRSEKEKDEINRQLQEQ